MMYPNSYEICESIGEKRYVSTEGEALLKYLHKGGSAYVECSYPPFSVVAQKIHEAGGIVSLAHPAEYGLNDEETETYLAFTGGSDFHGNNDNGIDLGMGGENMMVPDSFLASLF